METKSTQQEILILTGTTFSSRQLIENDNLAGNKNLTEREKLEEACWNGLLEEMLPEIYNKSADAKKIYLWEIKEADAFIELGLSEFPPEETDKYFSIDPYSFLTTKLCN